MLLHPVVSKLYTDAIFDCYSYRLGILLAVSWWTQDTIHKHNLCTNESESSYEDAQIRTKTTCTQCTRPPAGVLNGVVFYNPESEVWNTVVRSKCFKRASFYIYCTSTLATLWGGQRGRLRERETPASHRPSVARWHSSLVKDVGGWIFSSICLPNRSQKSGESNTDLYAPEIKTWNKLRKSKMRLFPLKVK